MNSTNSNYRIVVADDHHIFRLGLRKLIEEVEGFAVVAEAADGRELLDTLTKTDCDLLITDLSMPKMSGIEAIEKITNLYPDLKIMVLSMHKEREYFRKVLSMGIDAYILKDDIYERLMSAIKSVRMGKKSFSDELTSFVIEDYNVIQESEITLELLTKREKEVLKLIAAGHTNKDIGEVLDISVRTVEAHRAHLMEKLGLKNIQEIMKFAIAQGIA